MGTALTRNSDKKLIEPVANCQIILHFLGSCKMEESNEMKAGHAPAQKVGGVRIAQKPPKVEKVDGSPPKVSEEDKEEFGEDKPVKAASSSIVSGAKVTDDVSFPTEAVKSFHDKPMPTHDKGASNKPKVIQQPRK